MPHHIRTKSASALKRRLLAQQLVLAKHSRPVETKFLHPSLVVIRIDQPADETVSAELVRAVQHVVGKNVTVKVKFTGVKGIGRKTSTRIGKAVPRKRTPKPVDPDPDEPPPGRLDFRKAT